MSQDLVAGDVFLFVGRGARRAKCLWFDGTGLVLLSKILEQGHFAKVWERAESGVAEMTMSELMVFLEGCAVVGKASIVPRTYGDYDKSRDQRAKFSWRAILNHVNIAREKDIEILRTKATIALAENKLKDVN